MNIAVLGMGAWGQALSGHLTRRHRVRTWSRSAQATVADATPYADIDEATADAQAIVLAVPLAALAEVAGALTGHAGCVIWTCKGLDLETLSGPAEMLRRTLGDSAQIAGLSGPSFAHEVAAGQPTALVAVAADDALARTCAGIFHFDAMRVYTSTDVAGVQAGGALKNVLAIAAGIASGLGLGDNARAALITRGLQEMARFGAALGARTETLFGLSGLGDLVLTATSGSSRNFRFGEYLGRGETVDVAAAHVVETIEGRHTAAAVHKWSTEQNVEMPICCAVAAVLAGTITPADAVADLLARDAKEEA